VNGPRTDQSAAISTPNAPYPRFSQPQLEVEPDPRRRAPPRSLVSQKHAVQEHEVDGHVHDGRRGERRDDARERALPRRAHVTAERDEGPAGQVSGEHVHGGCEQPLDDGRPPDLRPSSVPQLTSAAPTGPHSTTAASDAMVLADQARPRAFSSVAEDSQATRSRPRTPDLAPVEPGVRSPGDHDGRRRR